MKYLIEETEEVYEDSDICDDCPYYPDCDECGINEDRDDNKRDRKKAE